MPYKIRIPGMVISKQRFELPYKFGLYIDQPMIGIIDHFSEPAAVEGKRQPPEHKNNKPEVCQQQIYHGFFFGNQGKKALVLRIYSSYPGFIFANDFSSKATPEILMIK